MKKNSRLLILFGAMLGTLLYSLDQLIVATAIPRIASDLNGLSQLSWVFTAYMLTSTVTVPIYGKLSDIFGRRNFYILGIVIFLAGSLLSGLSQNMTQLIFFRGLQGIGGGAMSVNTVAIIGDIFPPRERGRWQGLNQSMYGLATVAGPLLGGWITDNVSWRWIFYINIPIGILAIIVILANMPLMANKTRSLNIDFPGAALITTGLVPLLLALVWGGDKYNWTSWQIILLLGFAFSALFGFILVEKKAREPIVSLSLFKSRVFVLSNLTVFITMIGLYGAILYIPLFAQEVTGASATNSGLILLPMVLGLVSASVISGQIISWTGKYKVLIIIGMMATVLGMSLFTQIGVNTTNLDLSWRMVVLGIGMGMGLPIFTTIVQSAFGEERLGEVTAGSQLFRNIGGTVSTAALGGIVNSQLSSRLLNIQSEPFITAVKHLSSTAAAAVSQINVNTVQSFLSAERQSQLRDLLTRSLVSKPYLAIQDQLQYLPVWITC